MLYGQAVNDALLSFPAITKILPGYFAVFALVCAPKLSIRCFTDMSFERFHKHRHIVADNMVCVSYDRFTTKFEVKIGSTIAYSKYFCFWPRHNATIQIGSSSYALSVYWFFIWGASLKKGDTVVVKELLPKRRRRSISLLGYGVFILLLRAAFIVFAP